jgi:hypothetical protein
MILLMEYVGQLPAMAKVLKLQEKITDKMYIDLKALL